jgi:hypothetical protein
MVQGIKSKTFGCIWKTMFISAMCYPDKIDLTNKEHVLKQKHYKTFYGSFKYTIPCKYCREYTATVLEKKFPLNFTGRVPLMHSLYIWKSEINQKLINQGCKKTKVSPPFKEILASYEKLRATCNKKIGKCV